MKKPQKNFRYFILLICLLSIISAVIGWQVGGLVRKTASTSPVDTKRVMGLADVITIPPTETKHVSLPYFSLDSIFAADHSWVAALPQEKTVTLMATGDVLPARSVNYKMVKDMGFRWPFEKTAGVLSGVDLTVVNLETPLLADCPPTQTGMIFCGDARAIEGLTFAGIDVATLGNNHIGNHFLAGAEETARILTGAGIVPATDVPVYKEVKGTRFAFLSYSDVGAPEAGVPWADREKIPAAIAQARKNADIVVVSYHWGDEYVTQPNSRQTDLAHFTIDAGADLIIGNHPHWIQPVEIYKDKFISYAHGNFVFDQEWSEETKLGVVGRYIFYEGRLVDVEYLPVRIVDYGQPYFLAGFDAQKVLDGMQAASKQVAQ